MDNTKIYAFYYSPCGGTKKIITHIAEGFDKGIIYHDMYNDKIENDIVISKDDSLIVALPVYGGRIPKVCINQLQHIKGQNGNLISIVVYGNRSYGDALIELSDILTTNNFDLFAGATFIAEHSLLKEVAKNRPDSKDYFMMDKFLRECNNKLKNVEDLNYEVVVPGKRPYRSRSLEPKTVDGSNRLYSTLSKIFKRLWSHRHEPEWYI